MAAASRTAPEPLSEQLGPRERQLAGGVALLLLVVAVLLVVLPPKHDVALPNCAGVSAGCIVSVHSDLSIFAAALAAVGSLLALLGIQGTRFTAIKGPGFTVESTRGDRAGGLPKVDPQQPEESGGQRESDEETPGRWGSGTERANPAAARTGAPPTGTGPITIDVTPGEVPVAVARLTIPMCEVDRAHLRTYQRARRESQRAYFVTHVLGPATQPGQRYSVAITVSPHHSATETIRSASFYLGRSWGNRVFPGKRGDDGRFGIVTEAYGEFLALCELEFADGSRVLLDHYCDFGMGELLPRLS